MQPTQPSRTAFRVAVRRAVHQLVDRPLVFEDPLALRIVGGSDKGLPHQYDPATDETPALRALRAFVCVRSRIAEDMLAEAVSRGARQYVVLGAGLDTFAYRNPYTNPPVRVFEVDHPATQQWKRDGLARAGIAIPASMTFAPIDFERQTLAVGLPEAGWDRDAPTFFSWLGVTPYLTREAIGETLAFIGNQPAPGSGIVFDYAIAPSQLTLFEQAAYRVFAKRVEAAGEPWLSHYVPAELIAEMRSHGYREVSDLTSALLNARYFADRQDGLRVGSLAHVMTGWSEG